MDQETFATLVKDAPEVPAAVKIAIVALATGTTDPIIVEKLVADHIAGLSPSLQPVRANAINALVARAKAVSAHNGIGTQDMTPEEILATAVDAVMAKIQDNEMKATVNRFARMAVKEFDARESISIRAHTLHPGMAYNEFLIKRKEYFDLFAEVEAAVAAYALSQVKQSVRKKKPKSIKDKGDPATSDEEEDSVDKAMNPHGIPVTLISASDINEAQSWSPERKQHQALACREYLADVSRFRVWAVNNISAEPGFSLGSYFMAVNTFQHLETFDAVPHLDIQGLKVTQIRAALLEYGREITTGDMFLNAHRALIEMYKSLFPEQRDVLVQYNLWIASQFRTLGSTQNGIAKMMAVDRNFRMTINLNPKEYNWASTDLMQQMLSLYFASNGIDKIKFRPTKGWLDHEGNVKAKLVARVAGSGGSLPVPKTEPTTPGAAVKKIPDSFCKSYNTNKCPKGDKRCRFHHKCSSNGADRTIGLGCGLTTCRWKSCPNNPDRVPA